MKAINHRIFSVALLLMLNGSWLEILYSFFLSSLPDQMERIGSKRLLSHRGFSHDLGLWGGFIALLLLLPISPTFIFMPPYPLWNEIFRFRTWILFYPPFVHALTDLLTPKGVPFLGIRISFPILAHDWWKEYILTWGLLIASGLIHAEKLTNLCSSLWRRIALF